MAIKLPNPNYFQASQISVYLPTGKGTFKEIIYKKTRDAKGKATWTESK